MKRNVTKAEITWTVMSAISLRFCDSLSNCFQEMFPESKIAQNFSHGRTKCTHIQTYGIFPYFFSVLMNEIKRSDHFSVSFDESMNKVTQNAQADISIQFGIN